MYIVLLVRFKHCVRGVGNDWITAQAKSRLIHSAYSLARSRFRGLLELHANSVEHCRGAKAVASRGPRCRPAIAAGRSSTTSARCTSHTQRDAQLDQGSGRTGGVEYVGRRRSSGSPFLPGAYSSPPSPDCACRQVRCGVRLALSLVYRFLFVESVSPRLVRAGRSQIAGRDVVWTGKVRARSPSPATPFFADGEKDPVRPRESATGKGVRETRALSYMVAVVARRCACFDAFVDLRPRDVLLRCRRCSLREPLLIHPAVISLCDHRTFAKVELENLDWVDWGVYKATWKRRLY
ncbi:hypothetical protein MTO96_049552 [Rhipicephalus appendiculatus]